MLRVSHQFYGVKALYRFLAIFAVFGVGFLLIWTWRAWNWYPVLTAVIFGLWSAILAHLYWYKPEGRMRNYAKHLLILTAMAFALYSYSIIRASQCGFTKAGLECVSMSF